MDQITIIGIDISKKSFQLHGATAEGEPVIRKMLSRGKFLAFLSEVPPCQIVMEACGSAHYWGRQIIVSIPAENCSLFPIENCSLRACGLACRHGVWAAALD